MGKGMMIYWGIRDRRIKRNMRIGIIMIDMTKR